MSSVSVVVPFKRTDYLGPLLKSLIRAGIPDHLVLVYDGKLNSGTLPHFEAFRELNATVVDTGIGLGVSAARNVGMREVESEYVVFLDSDDMLADHAIHIIKSWLAVLGKPDVVYGNLQNIGTTGEVCSTDRIERAATMSSFRDVWQIYAFGMSQLGATYIKSSYLRAIGGFNESIQAWTDRDLQYRLLLGLGRICFIPEILMQWRHGHEGRLSELAHKQFKEVMTSWPAPWPKFLWDPVFLPYRGAIVDHIWSLAASAAVAKDVSVQNEAEHIRLSRHSVNRFLPKHHAFASSISARTRLPETKNLSYYEKELVFELVFDGFLEFKHDALTDDAISYFP